MKVDDKLTLKATGPVSFHTVILALCLCQTIFIFHEAYFEGFSQVEHKARAGVHVRNLIDNNHGSTAYKN